ncbi:MAG: cytochrome c [Qipengyuania citrea]|uniref:cytochrome c n=1 Tax=Alphaproteobacteria TaxID=28211 RepID=UPI0032639709
MKRFSYALVIALAVLFGALANDLSADRDTASPAEKEAQLDQRETVNFNREQAHFALMQMRGLLETLVLIDEAEADADFAAMENAATLQTHGQTPRHPEGFHDAMPDEFRAMSQQMRKGFTRAAAAAQAGDLDTYFIAKRQVQGTCVACHEGYRIPNVR